MNTIYQKNFEQYAHDLLGRIEEALPTAQVTKTETGLLVMHRNTSASTILPLSDNSLDLGAMLSTRKAAEEKNITYDECIALLQKIDALPTPTKTEQTTATNVGPVPTPILGPDHVSKWWGLGQRHPVGHVSASLNEVDPLGKKGRKEAPDRSIKHKWQGGSPLALDEGTIAVHAGSLQTQNLKKHLVDVLPDDTKVELNDAGNLDIQRGLLKVVVQPVGGGNLFNVLTFVNQRDEWTVAVPKQMHLSFGGVVKFVFSAVDTAPKLAEEIRGEPLTTTKQSKGDGWQTVQRAFQVSPVGDTSADEEETLDQFLRSLSVSGDNLRGDTIHNGHPVSVNEHRDVSRPFADTMGGKVLVDMGRANGGVQLVDKSDLPPQKYLSHGENGVEFVTENVNTHARRYTSHGYDTVTQKPLLERWKNIISR